MPQIRRTAPLSTRVNMYLVTPSNLMHSCCFRTNQKNSPAATWPPPSLSASPYCRRRCPIRCCCCSSSSFSTSWGLLFCWTSSQGPPRLKNIRSVRQCIICRPPVYHAVTCACPGCWVDVGSHFWPPVSAHSPADSKTGRCNSIQRWKH